MTTRSRGVQGRLRKYWNSTITLPQPGRILCANEIALCIKELWSLIQHLSSQDWLVAIGY